MKFCNITDLQLKSSTSKDKSATVKDAHPDIARGIIRKRLCRQAHIYIGSYSLLKAWAASNNTM